MEKDRPESTTADILGIELMIASFEDCLSIFEALLKSEEDILALQDSKQWLIFWQGNARKILNIIVELKTLARSLGQYQQALPAALLDRYNKASKLDATHDLLRQGILKAYVELGQSIGDRGLKC